MAINSGRPVADAPSEHFIPDDADINEMHDDVERAHAERRTIPVFSEAYLYPRLGKEDARFVLAVAEEFDRLQKFRRAVLKAHREAQALDDTPGDYTAEESASAWFHIDDAIQAALRRLSRGLDN